MQKTTPSGPSTANPPLGDAKIRAREQRGFMHGQRRFKCVDESDDWMSTIAFPS